MLFGQTLLLLPFLLPCVQSVWIDVSFRGLGFAQRIASRNFPLTTYPEGSRDFPTNRCKSMLDNYGSTADQGTEDVVAINRNNYQGRGLPLFDADVFRVALGSGVDSQTVGTDTKIIGYLAYTDTIKRCNGRPVLFIQQEKLTEHHPTSRTIKDDHFWQTLKFSENEHYKISYIRVVFDYPLDEAGKLLEKGLLYDKPPDGYINYGSYGPIRTYTLHDETEDEKMTVSAAKIATAAGLALRNQGGYGQAISNEQPILIQDMREQSSQFVQPVQQNDNNMMTNLLVHPTNPPQRIGQFIPDPSSQPLFAGNQLQLPIFNPLLFAQDDGQNNLFAVPNNSLDPDSLPILGQLNDKPIEVQGNTFESTLAFFLNDVKHPDDLVIPDNALKIYTNAFETCLFYNNLFGCGEVLTHMQQHLHWFSNSQMRELAANYIGLLASCGDVRSPAMYLQNLQLNMMGAIQTNQVELLKARILGLEQATRIQNMMPQNGEPMVLESEGDLQKGQNKQQNQDGNGNQNINNNQQQQYDGFNMGTHFSIRGRAR